MYTIQQLREREVRAVSPVIGVVLMVAVTIMLAAVIGAFVMDLAPENEQIATPMLDIDGQAGPDNISLTHDGGETLDLSGVSVVVDGSSTAGNTSLTGTLEPGERVVVHDLDASNETRVAIRHDPSGEIIAESTVKIE